MLSRAFASVTLFQIGQQYSDLLLTIVLKRVSIRKKDLLLKTHAAIVLALSSIFWMCGVHEQSLERRTPRSLTVRLASIAFPQVMCHAIGKYIDSSGLDKLFTQSGIYGHLVVNKILARGKI